jgi:hypothetical protein
MAGVEESKVKVWQPEGFEGLEIESLTPGPNGRPPSINLAYSIQVVMQCCVRVRYRQGSQTLDIRQPAFMLQNPGGIWGFDNTSDLPVIALSLEINPELFEKLTVDLNGTSQPYFPDQPQEPVGPYGPYGPPGGSAPTPTFPTTTPTTSRPSVPTPRR